MPWLARAPRWHAPPARPRLRVVKAAPPPDWEALLALADAQAPTLARAFMAALTWEGLPNDVRQALLAGNGVQAAALLTLHVETQMNALYAPAVHQVAESLLRGVAVQQWETLREMLRGLEVPSPIPTKLPGDLLAPRAIDAVYREGLRRVQGINTTTMEALRPPIMEGIAQGRTTPQIARELVPKIGLTTQQARALDTYAAGLAELPAEKREARIERKAMQLRRKRANLVAVTETQAALNTAVDQFFQAASGSVGLAPGALKRFWLVTPDERTCLCAGTMVATPEGEKPIEALLPGDRVCTSEGERKLLATMSRPFAGMLIIVHTTDDRVAVLTHDHPVWVNGDWSDAETLRPGDSLQAFNHKPLQVASLIQFTLQDPDDRPAVFGQPARASYLFRSVSMPIIPINFQRNARFTQGEIDAIAANLIFLHEGNVHHGQHFSNDPFWGGLPVEGSIATKRTELPIACTWQTTERDAALATGDHLGRSPADFRAIGPLPPPLASKCLTTSLTGEIAGFFATTGHRADGIAFGNRSGESERCQAHRACFRDHLGSMGSFVTRSRTPPALSTGFCGGGDTKRLPALLTGRIFWSQTNKSVAASRTISSSTTLAVFPREFLSTVCTIVGESHRAYLQKIIDDYSINYSIPVYDIEVETPHNFYAAHFLVHNCPICRPIPGLNAQGRDFGEAFQTPKGPTTRPPLHPRCRCVVLVRPSVLVQA